MRVCGPPIGAISNKAQRSKLFEFEQALEGRRDDAKGQRKHRDNNILHPSRSGGCISTRS